MVALIAVSAAVYAIDKPYSYTIPPSMELCPGVRVMVPFGRGNRHAEGIVLEIQESDETGLKPILSVLDEKPVVSAYFIRMAAFLRDRYFCTFYDAIKTMLPAGLWFHAEQTFTATDKTLKASSRTQYPLAEEIMQFLSERGGSIAETDLKQLFPSREVELEHTLQFLLRQKYLLSNLDYSRNIQDKTEQIISLAIPAEEAMEYAVKKQRSAPMQYEVLKLLCAVGSGSSKEICYLTGASRQTLRRLETLGFVSVSVRDVYRSSLPDYVEPAKPLILNQEQSAVYEVLSRQSQQKKPGVALLHGVTGSGKTAVYLKLIRDMLDKGRASILFVPEIALTPQLIQLLMSQFGDTVAVLHSALRVSERYDAWKKIQSGHARVVIGTRSAVFAPVQNLGLLILDEEQEHTYKSENTPRYHAREVAIYRGAREGALVLLGSATPSIETMYLAKSGVYSYHRLNSRYNQKALPEVEIVDLKKEIRRGNPHSLSSSLQQNLRQAVQNDKQSILFLNRRGAGRCVICVECGEVPHCPRCSVSLTYHKANERLMCHYCGYSQPAVERCDHCGGAMKHIGVGTQKIELELNELYPEMPVLRMDADTISASNSHDVVLNRFQTEKIPVLIGTQMVTKGLNFENVTLVGVVDADMSLYVNHFRAAETTFSMLTQVIGRSGRGSHAGKAVIQTMTPEHTVIQLAAKQDYDSFYDLEISMRRLHRCPPFADLFTIMFTGPFESSVMAAAHDFRTELIAAAGSAMYSETQMQILGPSPAAVAKINNAFRYRLTIRCENSKQFRLLLSQLLKNSIKDKRHKGVTVFADINSYE